MVVVVAKASAPAKPKKPKLSERERKIMVYTRTIDRLEREALPLDPKWAAGMIRHYKEVLERLKAAK